MKQLILPIQEFSYMIEEEMGRFLKPATPRMLTDDAPLYPRGMNVVVAFVESVVESNSKWEDSVRPFHAKLEDMLLADFSRIMVEYEEKDAPIRYADKVWAYNYPDVGALAGLTFRTFISNPLEKWIKNPVLQRENEVLSWMEERLRGLLGELSNEVNRFLDNRQWRVVLVDAYQSDLMLSDIGDYRTRCWDGWNKQGLIPLIERLTHVHYAEDVSTDPILLDKCTRLLEKCIEEHRSQRGSDSE